MTRKELAKALLEIAQSCMAGLEGRDSLEMAGSDEEDCIETTVGGLEAALEMAYELGRKNA